MNNRRTARNRAHTRSGLWVILTLSVAIYCVSADTIVLNSGETLKGRITSESDLNVTISIEASTGKTDKTIAKSEIVGMTRSSPAEDKPEATAAETPSADEESKGEDEDSSAGLPEKYTKNYLIAGSTISPNKKFAVIYPTRDYYESADNAKDYLITLQPFSILGALQAEEPYFQSQSHGGISSEWSDDSSVALITLDGKWGPRDVFLVEFHNGKPSRTTNVLRKARDLLPPNERKAIFVEDTTFQLDGTSRVVIEASVQTSPNDLGLSPDAWNGHVEAIWDVKQAKFTSKKVSGRKRGADAYRNRGQSAVEDKPSSPEDIQNAIGLSSKGWDYYLSLAWYYLFDRNPYQAIAACLKALELSPRNATMIKVALAHAYLFDNQFDKAKAIYLENKNAKLRDDDRSFSQAVLDDFKDLQEAGITQPDMEKIKALLTSETKAPMSFSNEAATIKA